MSSVFDRSSVRDLAPDEVARGLEAGEIVLVDVREPNETMLERIPGSVLVPLSTFDPDEIPDPEGRTVVFSCRSGNRSVKASELAQAAGLPYKAHLAGGIIAWKAAGYPTEQ
jgi:rhodanese-related sulfurtransferase